MVDMLLRLLRLLLTLDLVLGWVGGGPPLRVLSQVAYPGPLLGGEVCCTVLACTTFGPSNMTVWTSVGGELWAGGGGGM